MKYIKTFEVSKEYEEKYKLMRYYTLLIGIALNNFLTTVSNNDTHMESEPNKSVIYASVLKYRDTQIFHVQAYSDSITVYVYKREFTGSLDENILDYINDIFQRYCISSELILYNSFCAYNLENVKKMENLVKEIDDLENYNMLLDAEKYNL